MITISPDLLRFLNKLPTDGDLSLWLVKFRSALHELLNDVDKVVISLNHNCNVGDPTLREVNFSIVTIQQFEGEARQSVDIAVPNTNVNEPAKYLIDAMRRSKIPLDTFHPATTFDYKFAGVTRVGSIILFRDRKKPPISAETIDLMKSLEPFFVFMLSDAVTRHHYMKPAHRDFYETCSEIAVNYDLSDREFEVMLFHLFGFNYSQIADKLSISIEAVKKRVLKIHRKAGVKGHAELFAQYFAPLLTGMEIKRLS